MIAISLRAREFMGSVDVEMTPPNQHQDGICASRTDTIKKILKRAKRQAVPLRPTALQQGRGAVRTPGPLISLVKNKDPRALDLYLLVHALASNAPFSTKLSNAVWARALGMSGSAQSNGTAVSRITRRLEQLKLIERQREGRVSKLTLLDESGNGSPYQHPAKKTRYFKLPHAYWLEGWHEKLSMPGKILLLIGLSLKPVGFILPISKARDWYGLSTDTAQRGLDELHDVGLLVFQRVRKLAPLAPKGFTYDRHFTLLPPFDRTAPDTDEPLTEEVP